MTLTKIKDTNIQLFSHFQDGSPIGLYSYNLGNFLKINTFYFVQYINITWKSCEINKRKCKYSHRTFVSVRSQQH